MLSHRAIVANTLQYFDIEPLGSHEVLLAVLPFYHIYPFIIFLAGSAHSGLRLPEQEAHYAPATQRAEHRLPNNRTPHTAVSLPLTGHKAVSMPRFDFATYLAAIEEHGVTRSHIAPPVATMLSKDPLVEQFDLSSLTHMVCAAAPLGEDLQNAVEQRISVTIKQAYGMTEMSPLTNFCPDDNIRQGSAGMIVARIRAAAAVALSPDRARRGLTIARQSAAPPV